jgi:nucleoid-associated protein YgaU
MDGPTHEPLYLKLEWGDLVFHCRLVSVNVSYTLFNRQGRPIRAELACAFKGSLQLSKRVQKSSPDLSHSRLVEAEDNITIMTNKIYKNPAYYIRVAQANRLNNFRRLPMELELQFPPLEK